MYTHGMAFFGVMKKFHCIQINRRSKSLFSKLLYFSHAVSESCPFKEYGGGMCPLGRLDQSQISPTNGRFDPLHIHQLKSTPFHYDDRGGR